VLALIGRHRWWFAGVALGALLLRLFFVWQLPMVTNDSLFYAEIARGLLGGHGLAIERDSGWGPTLSRLPGYPAYLALSFLLGGEGSYRTAMLLQLPFDLLTCFLIADIARRAAGERAARSAFLLAAFCPFLANYAAAALTECLEIFCIAAALDCVLIALERGEQAASGEPRPRPPLGWWALGGVFCGGAILLRPDGGLILAAIALPVAALGWRHTARRRELAGGVLLLFAVSLAPLVPWTLRNWRDFHLVQPLVSSHANDPGDFVPLGWERWLRTWLVDYSSMEDVAFQVDGGSIDPANIPPRASTSESQRLRMLILLRQYNTGLRMTPELDRSFAELAAENVRAHPLRFYLLMPSARLADMWLRPRTEMLPLDTHFWNFAGDPYDSACSLALAALNLFYLGAAAAGLWLLRRREPYWGLLLCYPLLRSLLLAAMGAAEDRYTLECLPFVLVLAAAALSWREVRAET
jgi:4-amino-4-deoxy-L-arabinose transferase-like glycosyltransferase